MTRVCLLVACLLVSGPSGAQDEPLNIALHAPYTVSPSPNYGYCTDPDDKTQLTDGIYSQGYFWVQKGTVGWSGKSLVFIKIDLGQVQPICGLSYNCAAGAAQVEWPQRILMFVSDDGAAWHRVCDLMELIPGDLLPGPGIYGVRKLMTTDLKTHGRFVQLAVMPAGPYCFVDEIEVYKGPDDLLQAQLPGEGVSDVALSLKTYGFNALIKDELKRNLEAAREDIAACAQTEEQRAALTGKADALAEKIRKMPLVPVAGFRAVFPMTDLQREIFAFQAEVWRTGGIGALKVWKSHRWDYLAPSELRSDAPAPVLAVRMMNGETRADVVNFTNPNATDLKLHLRVDNLPGGTNPNYVKLREVLHTGTRRFVSVAAALPEMKVEGDVAILTVEPGMTRQVWVEFSPQDLPAGKYEGTLAVTGVPALQGTGPATDLRIPIALTISPLRFPEETTLLVGGWDYTDSPNQYGVKPTNRAALIQFLKEHRVNMPWATSAALTDGQYDAEGNMVKPPDTARFDEWVRNWEGAKLYMVFLAKGDAGGAFAGSEANAKRVAAWAHFWAQHMRDLGLKASQLGMLIYDEPHSAEGYRINAEWAKAIQAAEPELVLFVDPTPQDPEGLEEMCATMDVLCPMRPQYQSLDWAPGFWEEQRKQGRELWFYSCSGPARSFDPFSYYLLQAWHAFAIGGKGSCFWAFGDDNGADVWNEYTAEAVGPYCASFLDPNGVTTAKWFEAIRESAEDFEYLVMLRDRVSKLEAEGKASPQLTAAKELLKTGPQRVLAESQKPLYGWLEVKDRSVADRVRGEVLDALEGL